jgi:hypothetical protein
MGKDSRWSLGALGGCAWLAPLCLCAIIAGVGAESGGGSPGTASQPGDANSFPEDLAPEWKGGSALGNRYGLLAVLFRDSQDRLRAVEEYQPPDRTPASNTQPAEVHGLPAGSVLVRRTLYDEEGLKDGPQREWFRSGQLKSVGVFKHGVMDGRFMEYGERGAVLADYLMVNGTGTKEVRFEDGTISMRIPFREGKEDGVHVEYFRNGVPKVVIRYRQGMIVDYDKAYYASGRIQHFGTTDSKGELHGVIVYFKESGEVITGLFEGPTYWIHGRRVLPDRYREATRDDPGLPGYQSFSSRAVSRSGRGEEANDGPGHRALRPSRGLVERRRIRFCMPTRGEISFAT